MRVTAQGDSEAGTTVLFAALRKQHSESTVFADYFEQSKFSMPVIVVAGFVNRTIHMNGRIYDPTLGRMLQADPFIQAPTNTQSFNRYSYVFNNPLSGIDPSGYSFLSDIGDFFEDAIVNGLKVYVSSFCGYYAAGCYAGISAVEAKAQGASWADAALHGVVSGAAFYAGDQFNTAMGFSGGDDYGLNVSIVLPGFNANENSSEGNASRTAAQIAERTNTPWTGQKFVSGVVSTTWRMAGSNQRESEQSQLPEIFENEKFRTTVDSAISRNNSSVRGERELTRANRTLGLTIRSDGKGGFNFGEYPNDFPNSNVPRGLEEGSGFAGALRPIEGASALTVSLPVFARNNSILENARRFQSLSISVNAPVIVTSPRADIFVFSGNSDPVLYDPRN